MSEQEYRSIGWNKVTSVSEIVLKQVNVGLLDKVHCERLVFPLE